MAKFVILGFKTDYNGKNPVDMVQIAPSGEAFERVRTWLRIKDIKPPEHPNMESPSHLALLGRWEIIGPAYAAWKAGNDIPEDGTPLAVWSAVSPEQADVFRRMGVKTVEDVAEMGEAAWQRLPFPNKSKFPKMAADFLDGRSKVAQVAELDAMREKMAAMEEMLSGYMAAGEETKRGPGRPRKDAAA